MHALDVRLNMQVVHFEMPNTSEIFVHRSGRTGRAGNKGTAILMFTERERHAVRTIERELGCKFKEVSSSPMQKNLYSFHDGNFYVLIFLFGCKLTHTRVGMVIPFQVRD